MRSIRGMIMYTYSATKVCQTAWSIVFCENSPLKKRLWHNWKGGNFHPPTTLVSLSSWKGVCNKIVVDKRSNEMRWFSTQDLNVWLKDFFADLHLLQNVFSLTSFVPVKGNKNCCLRCGLRAWVNHTLNLWNYCWRDPYGEYLS